MDPVYSRDETVAAFRSFFHFLTTMFANPSEIDEPPPGGWPNMAPDNLRELRKTDAVKDLIRHLSYVTHRPFSSSPDCIPGCGFMNWAHEVDKATPGDTDRFELAILMSECYEWTWDVPQLPRNSVGIVSSGRESEVVMLSTLCGLVFWMDAPEEMVKKSNPRPSYFAYPLQEDMDAILISDGQKSVMVEVSGEESSKVPRFISQDDTKSVMSESQETPPTSDEEDYGNDDNQEEIEEDGGQMEAEDEDDDGNYDEENDDSFSRPTRESEMAELLERGPRWPIRHFFEMLKNQYRELNFIPVNEHDVYDTWSDKSPSGAPIPPGFVDFVRSIYRKHGWPDLSKYCKDACMEELKRELQEKYPECRAHNKTR